MGSLMKAFALALSPSLGLAWEVGVNGGDWGHL